MKEDGWYKEFGTDHILKFYHILRVDPERSVTARLYQYDQTRRRVVAQQQREFNSKWWMEQEIQNNLHEIPSKAVPFLMSF